ncbi:MAG: autotransporter-associated beta strand repeat-containing protein [Akkermansiaceae bacterium]|nr:autotransporter-associated beta strand repeat-containing protein [Akkermansiaceae bacterium]
MKAIHVFPSIVWITLAATSTGAVTWDNTSADGAWSTAANWDGDVEPTSADDVVFPVGLAGAVTASGTENALSLSFAGDYTLSGGTVALASGNSITVDDGVTATIQSTLNITDGLAKLGNGTLVLGANNTNTTGNTIHAGTLRIESTNAMGGTTSVTTVNDGTFLVFADGISSSRNITLMHGGTVAGNGTATNGGITTIDAAATSVSFATDASSDLLIQGNGSNDLTGGSASTVAAITGPGSVRLGFASNFTGSWNIPEGVLEIGNATALGNQTTSSVTLSGGTLSARLNTATNFGTGSPAAQLLMTADSGLRSDRTSVSAGVTHTLGTLSMGGQTLTVEPGPNVNSGTAGITLGDVTITGDPAFAVNDSGSVNGKLTTGSILGGGVSRALLKSGAGDLTVIGGTTDLVSGSSFVATGGGTIEMQFPDLGAAGTIAVSDAQNPFGAASVSITDGGLNLVANGSGTNAAQTYQVGNDFTFGGTFTLDANRKSGNNANKTFELPGATLMAGTEVTMVGDNTHGVVLTGPLALTGDATLKGVDITSRDGLLTLDGGITGGPGDALTVGGGTSPLNLTVNASSTYGGGTTVTGSNVTLNAVDALGTGPLTMTGGSMIVNTADALNGTVILNGGSLRVNGTDLLATNPLVLGGGAVEFRNNTGATVQTGGVTVSGASSLLVGNNGSGSLQTMVFPTLDVSGDTTLTVTTANSYIPEIQSLDLAGDLTLNQTGTMRIGAITEDISSRSLIKTGTGTLELNGTGLHSGGTEVLAGILQVNDGSALGTGTLTLGDTSGTATATARFAAGLTVPNDIVARNGGTGALTLDAVSGNVIWSGDVDLQRTMTVDNGNAALASTLSGTISGAGGLTKVSAGEVVLSNAANSFGSGDPADVTISDGVVTVPSDGALGNAANGVTLGGTDGVLKIDGTFSSARTITGTGTSTGVAVTSGNEFTLTSPLAGSGAIVKSDAGTMTIDPAVDSSGRGPATTGITGGVLRVQGQKALSDGGPFTLNGTSGTLELLVDANTDFGHPLTANGNGTSIHVDRAIGGTGTNGRHRLGDVSTTSGNLTVTGANGYGLSLGAFTTTSNNTLGNDAPAPLQLDSLTGEHGNSTRTMTVSGSGDIEVLGAIGTGTGTGSYRLTKTGEGTFRFGTSVTGFGNIVTVRDGTLDLNGLTYLAESLVLGGGASVSGAHIDTSGGTLQLASGLSFNSASPPPEGARITGSVDLGTNPQTFAVNNSTGAALDLTIDGPITGTAGAAISKTGTGTFRMTGAGNTYPGLTSITSGALELGKSSGDAITSGGLSAENVNVSLLATTQIADTAPVTLSGANDTVLDLNDFTETIGALTLTQTDSFDYTAVRTGAAGTLVLNGGMVLNNNTNSSFSDGREVVITGSGTDVTPANDGTLDLGGAVRTIEVSTTTTGTNETKANATIETQIVNGGILKTGARTLILSHPNNTFAGDLVIAEGSVKPATPASLGTGTVSFANTGAASAGIDLGAFTGTYSDPFTIAGSGSGSTTITYSAAAPSTLELSGGFTLERDITFDVVNGSVNPADCAVLNVTGTIDDGAFTAGVTKTGDGLLDLAAGNTYSGATTIMGGTLRIPAESALGDGTSALTIDGGCLHATGSMVLTHDVVFGPDGGNLRVDGPAVVEIPGDLAWDAGESSFYGSGTTILSGTTSGGGGDLELGKPTAFAPGTFGDTSAFGHVLSLRGTSALPPGNLNLTNNAVLELGNGDFTRALGTGAGEVQLDTAVGAGWAAHGADRVVNLGGASATVVMGQSSPPFLFKIVSGNDYGRLILGSATATHQIDFQNPIELDNGASFVSRTIETRNGSAATDALLSGGITQSADPNTTYTSLSFTGDGTAEVSGTMSGEIDVNVTGTNTLRLTGTNSHYGDYYLSDGTLVIGGDASLGTPENIYVETTGTMDVSTLTSPVGLPPGGYFQMDGTLFGDVATESYFEGHGSVSGDLHALPGCYFFPNTGGTLSVGGDFTLDATAFVEFFANGLVPDTNFNRMSVTGAVNLSGDLSISASNLVEGDSIVCILNDGTDAINGTFTGLPEGAGIPIGDGLALQVTYQANGDGGSVGNDFGVTVVVDTFSTDFSIAGDGPVVVAPSDEIVINYTIDNPGPGDITDGTLEVTLPLNATFMSSTPAGTVGAGVLSITLPTLTAPDSTNVELRLTAPGAPDLVSVEATVSSSTLDPNTGNNTYTNVIAVLPGGAPLFSSVGTDGGGNLDLSFETVDGVLYVIQSSLDLIHWQLESQHFGTGSPVMLSFPFAEDREFFRLGVSPQDGNTGGPPIGE